MNRQTAATLISQNLTAIYGYAFARLYDKSDVDDLAGEIVLQILASCEKLECDEAFHGFAWRIAENTLCAFLRKKERGRAIELPAEELLERVPSSEQQFLERCEREEEIHLLRRELSLLSRTNREVSVAYYVDGKSCREIASELKISVDMVKYHLFKTRKLLKEGIGMTRKLGEKSYNPGVFRLDFWGDWNHYNDLFKRKLPGSIMLAAYDLPLTAEELSIELGVSMPYLEDELELLEKAGLLTNANGRYRTALVILTDDYEKEFARASEGFCNEPAEQCFELVRELLPEIRTLDFTWKDRSDNELYWMALNIAFLCGWYKTKSVSPLGEVKPLKLGGHGWVFGYDNDYANGHFGGITMHNELEDDHRAWFSAENYNIIKSAQHYSHYMFLDRTKLMIAAILGESVDKRNPALALSLESGQISCIDGKLTANFPVFAEESYNRICAMLEPIANIVCDTMVAYSERAEKILDGHVPESVRSQCGDIAKIHHRLDVMALLFERLVESGRLCVPTEKNPICIFGVKR